MILIDPGAKTTRLIAKYLDGEFIDQITGSPVSMIANEAICEIVVLTSKVFDEDLLETLNDESEAEILPKGAVLLATISEKSIPAGLLQHAPRRNGMPFGRKERTVEIILKQSLRLKFRGSKMPELKPCSCHVPCLEEDAISINHAFSLISIAFEPHRKAHTGNVFQKVLYRLPNLDYGLWRELEQLRADAVQQYGNYVKRKYQALTQGSIAEPFSIQN